MRHNLIDVVDDTVTNAEGFRLFTFLDDFIRHERVVELSFKDAHALSSSFLNSSLGELIANYGFEKFKTYVKIVDIKQSIANQLRNYLNSCNLKV